MSLFFPSDNRVFWQRSTFQQQRMIPQLSVHVFSLSLSLSPAHINVCSRLLCLALSLSLCLAVSLSLAYLNVCSRLLPPPPLSLSCTYQRLLHVLSLSLSLSPAHINVCSRVLSPAHINICSQFFGCTLQSVLLFVNIIVWLQNPEPVMSIT